MYRNMCFFCSLFSSSHISNSLSGKLLGDTYFNFNNLLSISEFQQIQQREQTEKLNLLMSCSQYKLWPRQPMQQVASLIEWISYPPNTGLSFLYIVVLSMRVLNAQKFSLFEGRNVQLKMFMFLVGNQEKREG